MKIRRFKFSFILLVSIVSTVNAQPSWLKKAAKSVFTVKTFSADGILIGSAGGFFTTPDGEAVSCFSPFRGASSAIVIDAQGKEFPVVCMLGANDTYDVAKFRVEGKKHSPITIATGNAQTGESVWILPYREQNVAPQGFVCKAENFQNDFDYYTLSINMPELSVGSPLLNEQGEAIGLMQQPYKIQDTLAYAVSAQFANSLTINGLSINDPTLKSTFIKKDLPNSIDQANLTLFMASSTLDSISFSTLINDFIKKFPNAPDGYEYRAQQETNAHQFAEAADDMQKAIQLSQRKDETHLNYSKLIYQKEIYMGDVPYSGWSLALALSEAMEAESINPLPIYRHQQAAILFAQKKYAEAYERYETLFQSEMRSAEIFYEASRCQEMLHDTIAELALLDSCVNMFSRPYLKEAAPYILARAQARFNAGLHREAVADFNDYGNLMPAQVNDKFYYIRHQAEVGGRLYQQALNDLNRAIELRPDFDLYYVERASLQTRVGLYDDAIISAQESIRLSPESSDGYLFLGLALCLKGMKAEGIKELEKAQALGDAQASDLIEKYAK